MTAEFLPADAPPVNAARSWEGLPIYLALAVLCFAVYHIALPGPFIFDDENQILFNQDVRQLWPLRPFLDESRPIVFYSFALNYAAARFQPYTYRLTNLAIHIAAACVLYDLVRRTLRLPSVPERYHAGAGALAAIISGLWALHPIQTSAVAYVVQRCESLMGLCYLFALYALLRGATAARGSPWYAAGTLAALLGAGSKEVIVTLPLVAALYDRAFLASTWRDIFRRRWFVYAAYLAAAGLSLFLLWNRLSSRSENTVGFGTAGVTPWEYLRSQPAVLLYYLRLVVWPDCLVLDYGWPKAESPVEIYGLGFVIVALLLAGAVLWWKQPALGFLGLTAFFILAPTSSFVPIADLAFEHRMYLPLACVVTLVVLAVNELLTRTVTDDGRRRTIAIALTLAVIFPLGIRTFLRNRDYRSAEVMWRGVVARNPQHSRGWNNLAAIVAKTGREEEAIDYYQRAIAANPREAMFQDNLGNVFARRHDYDQAAVWYRRAIETDAQALEPYIHLSQASLFAGRDAEAKAAVVAAEAQYPKSYKVNREWVAVWTWATDPSVADPAAAVKLSGEMLARAAKRKDSPDFQLLRLRADALAAAEQWDEALAATDAALELARQQRAAPIVTQSLELRREAFTNREQWTAEREVAALKSTRPTSPPTP